MLDIYAPLKIIIKIIAMNLESALADVTQTQTNARNNSQPQLLQLANIECHFSFYLSIEQNRCYFYHHCETIKY